MPSEQIEDASEPLETATELDRDRIAKRGSLYKMAKLGLIPCYHVGQKQTGVRFRRSEVLAALRRSAPGVK